MENTYQVMIAGAGPAGLATSLTLSAYQIPHCIIDAHASAPFKPGDALPPDAKPLLKQLGIHHLFKSEKHIPYYGNQSIWGSDQLSEKHFISGLNGHGYLIDRTHFEDQLRAMIAQNETPFYKGYTIKKVRKETDRITATIHNKSQDVHLSADIIVDATGRKSSVCRHLGVPKKELDQQMTISFFHQSANKIPRQILIEATENGWWYLSPTAENTVNCLFFTLKELLPSKTEIADFLKSALRQTQQVRKIISPTEKELNQRILMPSGTSYLEKPYDDRWLAVGDAAFSFDPISSYGITSALASGFYAGHALASKLAGEEDALISYHYIINQGVRAYLQKLSHQYAMETRWHDSYYWRNRLHDRRKPSLKV